MFADKRFRVVIPTGLVSCFVALALGLHDLRTASLLTAFLAGVVLVLGGFYSGLTDDELGADVPMTPPTEVPKGRVVYQHRAWWLRGSSVDCVTGKVGVFKGYLVFRTRDGDTMVFNLRRTRIAFPRFVSGVFVEYEGKNYTFQLNDPVLSALNPFAFFKRREQKRLQRALAYAVRATVQAAPKPQVVERPRTTTPSTTPSPLLSTR